MAARRATQAKAAAAAASTNLSVSPSARQASRLKSTSMTNLIGAGASSSSSINASRTGNNKLHRPVSRSALDNIHKGMNAKFTHVQSKVLLQNIRPSGAAAAAATTSTSSRIPSRSVTPSFTPNKPNNVASSQPKQSDRSQLINKIKSLQEELEKNERARESLEHELEREKANKGEQLQQLKLELQEKIGESERQNEEYHQKLLDAYELADQNRRAADTVLSESRQREDELRKKIDELELQLNELKEFVAMKEEMMSKMSELREQIKAERERYEEKTRNLNQMFESEKLSMRAHHGGDTNNHETSNYFRRTKPSLQSIESLVSDVEKHNSLGVSARRQNSQATSHRHHHKSEQDIYGSKLSTRVQDGARFAWKKSRKFASSVITGGLGAGWSACRKNNATKPRDVQQATGFSSTSGQQKHHVIQTSPSSECLSYKATTMSGEMLQQQQQQQNTLPVVVVHTRQACASNDQDQEDNANGDEHTSVVQVGATVGDYLAAAATSGSTTATATTATAQFVQSSPIHVHENNKLTIVTKFNDSDCCDTSTGASSAASERSRCESSSSGRGTASDESSSSSSSSATPSQNGDTHQAICDSLTHADRRASQPNTCVPSMLNNNNNNCDTQAHKRKASLFKASHLLSGSQAGLNKTFKSFLALASKHENEKVPKSPTACELQFNEQQHLEQQQQIDARNLSSLLNQHSPAISSSSSEREQQQDCNSLPLGETRAHAQEAFTQLEMELIDKVKQVGESYELSKLKTQNRTIELDARLASERLIATKMRLHQMNADNERLQKQLRACQQQVREHEKKLLLTETMLRQFVVSSQEVGASGREQKQERKQQQQQATASKDAATSTRRTLSRQPPPPFGSRFVRFGGARRSSSLVALPRRAPAVAGVLAAAAAGGGSGAQAKFNDNYRFQQQQQQQLNDSPAALATEARKHLQPLGSMKTSGRPALFRLDNVKIASAEGETTTTTTTSGQTTSGGSQATTKTTTTTTTTQQQQPSSRARSIIDDLRQRLNLGQRSSGRASGRIVEKTDAAIQADECNSGGQHEREDDDEEAQQKSASDNDDDDLTARQLENDYLQIDDDDDDALVHHRELLMVANAQQRRRRSISLDAFLSSSIVRDVAGERLIISRGWPASGKQHLHRHRGPSGRAHHKHRVSSGRHRCDATNLLLLRNNQLSQRVSHSAANHTIALTAALQPSRRGRYCNKTKSSSSSTFISETQKRRLLIEYLQSSARRAEVVEAKASEKVMTTTAKGATSVQKLPTQVRYELPVHSGRVPIAL